MNEQYAKFLEQKKISHKPSGFTTKSLPDTLYDFQKFCVMRALHAGRYALFEECGLGKTRQQIVFADEVVKHTNGIALILCPLSVAGQTIKEGENIGIEISRNDSARIRIANYEQLPNIDTSKYNCIILDESSILKNFEGKFRNDLISTFSHTPYKLCCSATPSPNDDMELGNHSEFLNAMSRNEMLAMYFVHDGGETSKWRLKGHAEDVFWQFVSTWATVVNAPSAIGFSDEGYILPDLKYVEHLIHTESKNNAIFNSTAVSATDFNAELRRTKQQRMERAAIIDASTDGQHIIWVKQNEEGELLRQMLHGAVEVHGSQSAEQKEEYLLAFASGEIRTLITKTSICGYGMNFQNCHHQTFASPDFSFERTYQGVRRSYRFGQKYPVTANIIVTDTMQNVLSSIKRKEAQFKLMQQRMQSYVSHTHGTSLHNRSYQTLKLPTWLK